MQITITGPRGCGSTMIAAEIVAHLREIGQEVAIVGPVTEKRTIEKQAKCRPFLTHVAKIIIVIGIEPEDETGVALRKANAVHNQQGKELK